MKNALPSLLIALAGVGAATAAELTPAQALARVQNHSESRKIIGKRNVKPELIAQLPELYVFSTGSGFMVLPANDVAMPLLAYADSGELRPEEIPALKWWLSTYSEQITAAAAAGISPQTESTPERKPVEPLLKTTWNQASPYNDLCPMIGTERTVTGCVATAMAQVMNYHQWPAKGQGEISYTWSKGGKDLSMDFSNVTFDWANMTDSYNSSSTAEQKTAVATLMEACGYSVEMNYGLSSTGGSGAMSLKIGGALINYFDYDRGIWHPERDCYTYEEWQNIIYEDLAAGRPVLYGGQSATGGHQFVCDGYSSDGFFHFNWGWGGTSDGYFQLNALNPGTQGIGGHAGGYNMGQSVTLGVKRPQADSKPVYSMSLIGDFKPTGETYTLGNSDNNKATFDATIRNSGALSLPYGTFFGIEFTPDDGDKPTYMPCIYMNELPPGYGWGSFDLTLNQSIDDGTYTARPVFKVPDGEWQPVQTSLNNIHELTVNVKYPDISFVAENAPGITLSDLPEQKTIYIGTKFVIPMTVSNNTATEFNGSIYPRILKSDTDDVVTDGTAAPVYLSGNETQTFDYVGQLYTPSSGALSPGNYRLVFVNDQSGKELSEPIAITIADTPAETSIAFSDFKFEGIQPGDKAKFSLTVTCTKGYFSGGFSITIYPEAGGYPAAYADFSAILNEGESVTNTYEVDLGEIDFGKYFACPYHYGPVKPYVYFDFLEHSTAIEEVTTEAADAPIYDLQGRRVAHPTPGQIYIRGNALIRF